MAAFAATLNSFVRIWQGRLDSNQRMPGSKPGALPLGDAPIVLQLDAVHPLSGQAPKRPVQHRDVASLGDKPWQGCWKLGRDSISFAFAWEGPKHATTSAGQSS